MLSGTDCSVPFYDMEGDQDESELTKCKAELESVREKYEKVVSEKNGLACMLFLMSITLMIVCIAQLQ